MKRIKSAISKSLIRLLKAAGYPWRAHGPEGGRFLVISATGVGDTLWSTPAIRAIKAAYPESKIDVVTTSLGRELLLHNPNMDDIFTFKRGAKGALPLIRLAMELRGRRYDAAFLFHISDRLLVPLMFLAGAGRAYGYNGKYDELAAVLDETVKGEGLHFIERRLLVAAARGIRPNGRGLDLVLTEAERAEARGLLIERGVDGSSPVIGIHPGAHDAFKCWPERNFIELGLRAERELGCKVIVTGGPAEVKLARRVAEAIGGSICLAGELSVRELAATISHLDALVANDTGPMHMGFALGVNTVGLFCPTDPALNGPLDAPNSYVLSMPPTCDKCIFRKCKHPVCMEQITVQMAFDALARALHAKAHPVAHGAN